MIEITNYIAGQFVPAATGRTLEDIEPATGAAYATLPASDETDVARAVEAARAAFPAWSSTSAAERSRIMLRIADLIERDIEALARAESIDTGKPIAFARKVDVPRAAANMRFFATAILHHHSELHRTDLPAPALNYTLRQSIGVVGAISPWNLPLYLFTWKLAPALATGNTVVGKPSEVTPMTASLFAQLCAEAGLPPGVLSIVHGRGPDAGAAIIRHPDVKAITFTGGTKTGECIAREAGPMFKKLALELGGKNPNIVFADCDFDQALGESVRAAFSNQGQICLCGSRLFIERPIFGQFLAAFVEKAASLRIGDPLEEATGQGAVVSQAHMDKVLACIERAKDEGGTIHCGGGRADPPNDRCRDGYFIEPTVISGLGHDCATNQEEIFGPVVTLMPFDTEDEAITWANSTRYGLSASVWTRDLSRAHRVAERLESGTVWVNCWLLRDLRVPFGGVKASGVGREGGEEALRFFTEPKNVCVRL